MCKAGDVEEAEETLGGAKTRSLQQVTRGLSSSCPSAANSVHGSRMALLHRANRLEHRKALQLLGVLRHLSGARLLDLDALSEEALGKRCCTDVAQPWQFNVISQRQHPGERGRPGPPAQPRAKPGIGGSVSHVVYGGCMYL